MRSPASRAIKRNPERVRRSQMNCEAREKTAIIMTKASSELLSSSSKRLKTKTKTKMTLQRRQFYIGYLAKFSLYMLAYGFAIVILAKSTYAADDAEFNKYVEWRPGYEGHGTTHEQNGQPHFPFTVFTEYTTLKNYTKSPPYSSVAMGPVYNVTHFIFDNFLSDYSALPPGYIDVKDKNTLVLGSKVTENDWRDLLAHYWVALLFVFFLLILVIVMPFIAVCYCCFCCCRRCKQGGCPPCDGKAEARKRFCCGLLLLLLIIGILFGVIIAFVTNKLVDTGLDETGDTMRRGSEDTCTYLKDVSKHIHHLFVNNYEELDTHLNALLAEAPSHIFLDLMDVSEARAWDSVERIFDNLRDARKEMAELQKLRNELQFYTSQLRDGLRGVKRDVNYACVILCGSQECLHFLKRTDIEFIDSSRCFHLDKLIKPAEYVQALDEALKKDLSKYPKDAIKRLQDINNSTTEAVGSIKAKLNPDLRKGHDLFRSQADKIRNIIDAVLSDIHLTTLRSTKNFEDLHEKLGPNRTNVNVVVCAVLLVILFFLVIALICGCCGRRRRGYRDDCCSKGTGASCLLLAMLLIFAVFSLVVLVGVFYFVLGLITYQGACAPLRDQEDNPLFRRLDAAIDLNSLVSTKKEVEGQTPTPTPPMRISNVLKACRANQTIFQFLKENNIYDINEMTRVKLLPMVQEDLVGPIFTGDLSTIDTIKPNEEKAIKEFRDGKLTGFTSAHFKSFMCKKLTPVDLPTLASQLKELRSSLWSQWGIYDWARTSLYNEAYNLQRLHDEFVVKIHSIESRIIETVDKIDELLTVDKATIKDTIDNLLAALKRSDEFMKKRGTDFVNVLLHNLTIFTQEQMTVYVARVINESTYNVGKCAPLAYIYDRGVDLICHRLVDPINGFWVGVLLCGLLFLPVLFVSHRLICLYNQIDPYSTPTVEGSGGSDYLYDAYSEREREHVPLANVPKKRRKAYERRREQQDYYEDASPGVSRVSRGGGSNSGGGGDPGAGGSNLRYNDVAPTHWDHEPPRYHNPPVAPPSSEYERPPPYYYPGASDQD